MQRGRIWARVNKISLKDPAWLIPLYPDIKQAYEDGKSELEIVTVLQLGLAGSIREEDSWAFGRIKWIIETMVDMCFRAWERGENPSAEELARRAIAEIYNMIEWIKEMQIPPSE